mmetsp:Transcript_131351/g.366197  ORF Transcript_131351/g.366197 Transcript_131351/m.366197 type:complete len:991 (+) Transcript_131351:168-3140(+)
MPSKYRKRGSPPLSEVKKVVAIVAAEVPTGTVTDIFHGVRRRCPAWAVTPHRVRKALAALQGSKKKGGKNSSSSQSSTDGFTRVYPHDVVELRPRAGRARHAQWQWRGQVLRVAGYDDGETTDDEDQELPAGHCSIFWLGHGLEQWPNALTKESSVRVLDRPWVLGDRVAKADNPRSLGTVVGVSCKLRFAAIPKPVPPSPEVSVQAVRAVGGFRAEDWVANEATRWVGKVEEAVFRVEVELCGKTEQRLPRCKGRHKPPVCVFQVSSEGLQGLEPAGGEDVTPQELSPHFPGQRVKAPARLWRQAEWLRGSLGRRSPRRGASICGVVSSVECCLLAVRWLAGVVKESHPPDEWVGPEVLRSLTVPNSSEGWAIGDHVQATPDSQYASAVIVQSRTVVEVRWADGSVEEGVPSVKLCPRPHISAHDFLPQDFVARSSDGFAVPASPPAAPPQGAIQMPVIEAENLHNQNQESLYGEDTMNTNTNIDTAIYGHDPEAEVETPLGVVTSVDLQARTAVVQWATGLANETEEVSVFELTDHPQVDVRLGDAVLIPEAQDLQWAGRVCGLRADGCAQVELLDGTSQWHDVRKLIVVDDGEGAESIDDGIASDAEGSTRSEGALSEISEGHEGDGRSEDEDEWAEAEEEPQAETPRGGEEGDIEETLADKELQADGSEADARSQLSAEADAAGAATPACAEGLSQEGSACSSAAPEEILPFDVCEEDVEPSDHYFLQHSTLGTRALMMAVRREMMVLRKGLLEGSEGVPAPIIVRTFSSRSDLFRAMVVGPPETPYAFVPFFFDLGLPSEYPREPPMAHFHAHYVGNERLNPNLYVDGKVCLSLLGTWSGPSWDPARSTLLQVLVSLQGLVLVEEPYFNEPGHECDAGTEQGRQSSALYNEHARLLALRAALNVAQSPPRGFRQIVASFFERFGPKLVEQCEEALQEPKASQISEGFRKVLAKALLPRLRERWGPREPSSSDPTYTKSQQGGASA